MTTKQSIYEMRVLLKELVSLTRTLADETADLMEHSIHSMNPQGVAGTRQRIGTLRETSEHLWSVAVNALRATDD